MAESDVRKVVAAVRDRRGYNLIVVFVFADDAATAVAAVLPVADDKYIHAPPIWFASD